MTRTLTSLAAATAIVVCTAAAPTPAQARSGGWIAAGILGGIATAAIVGSAWGAPYRYGYYGYGPHYAYAPGPYRYGPYYAAAGYPCHWRRERIWTGYGWALRRVRVCY